MTSKTSSRQLWAQRGVGGFFLALVVVLMVGGYRSPVAMALNRGEKITCLLFGVDAADASQHTDTLMLSVFDPMINRLSLLSIPRDTKIKLPGFLFNRINEIYGFHFRQSGDVFSAAQEVQKGVAAVLSNGGTPLPIPYFIEVGYEGFIRVIDLLGGIWVDIKSPMHYDDTAGHYHFHKEPGRYLLNGSEALFFVRYRGLSGDKGRIFRQHEFIRDVMIRLINPLRVFQAPRFISVALAHVKMNFSGWDALYLAAALRHLNSANVGFFVAPGHSSGAYWVLEAEPTASLASNLVLGTPLDKQFSSTIVSQKEQVTVNVWNAANLKNMAYNVTKYLRQKKFDVVDWGTYESSQSTSRVIDRRGNIDNAQSVAAALGIQNFHSEPNSKALVDVDVILGQDFSAPPSLERD